MRFYTKKYGYYGKILREHDVKRMMDESEDESEAETETLSQEDDGDGWNESDTETESHDNEEAVVDNSDSEDDTGMQEAILPLVLRNRCAPRVRLEISCFDSCLDEDNYNSIALPGEDERIEYTVKVKKGETTLNNKFIFHCYIKTC